jgi:hypothetical protein
MAKMAIQLHLFWCIQGAVAWMVVGLFVAPFAVEAVDVVCSNIFPVHPVVDGSDTLYARYCGNAVLSSPTDTSLTRAIVVVHGSSRNADQDLVYMEGVSDLIGNADAVIITPQFIIDEDMNQASLNLPSNTLFWSSLSWIKGNTSNGSPFQVSSFEVLDLMIGQLALDYPNFAAVVIVGPLGRRAIRTSVCCGRGRREQCQSLFHVNCGQCLVLSLLQRPARSICNNRRV